MDLGDLMESAAWPALSSALACLLDLSQPMPESEGEGEGDELALASAAEGGGPSVSPQRECPGAAAFWLPPGLAKPTNKL